jgi:beta-phosphoglucomutase
MSNIKGIIFDLDGVLISTDKFHYLAWKQLADKLGIPFSEKDNEQLRGVSRMESLELVLKNDPSVKLTEEEKIAAATEKNDCYREYLKTMTPDDVSAEVRETLTALHNKGYKLSVGSSSKNARFILSQTDLTRYFDAIADGNDIKNSKPDPEVFLTAASFLGLEPEVCAVVEDAEAGLEAAVAAGMLPVAYASAYGSKLGKVQLAKFSDLSKEF